jgi:hypothetical protein
MELHVRMIVLVSIRLRILNFGWMVAVILLEDVFRY